VLSSTPARRIARGFTVVELMITVAVVAILTLAAAPSLQDWVLNTRVRSTAEALQNGLRLAQSEAVRRSRQVVFVLTNNAPALDVAPTIDGRNWSAQVIQGLTDTAGEFIRGGRLADVAAGVTINATPNTASAICFNSIGALVANPAAGAGGAVCTVSAATPELRYDVAHPNGGRTLRVLVSNGGRIRMCDPARAIATSPDGCP